ncbi:MAG: acyl carrier protein [Pseudomonadales bacterium]|nr:acyl carrier protein [Pseudomonadales bacterium]
MTAAAVGSLEVQIDHVEQTVRSVLARLAILADAASIDTDRDLYDAGMTSHASVKFMLALEDAFDVEFPDELLKRETFGSIGVIAAAIGKLLGPR